MSKSTRTAPIANRPIPSGPELRRIREQHKLTQIQLAELLHMGIRRNPGARNLIADAVQRWESGVVMSGATWELLEAKLFLLRKGTYTLEDLLKTPLSVLIGRLL